MYTYYGKLISFLNTVKYFKIAKDFYFYYTFETYAAIRKLMQWNAVKLSGWHGMSIKKLNTPFPNINSTVKYFKIAKDFHFY